MCVVHALAAKPVKSPNHGIDSHTYHDCMCQQLLVRRPIDASFLEKNPQTAFTFSEATGRGSLLVDENDATDATNGAFGGSEGGDITFEQVAAGYTFIRSWAFL